MSKIPKLQLFNFKMSLNFALVVTDVQETSIQWPREGHFFFNEQKPILERGAICVGKFKVIRRLSFLPTSGAMYPCVPTEACGFFLLKSQAKPKSEILT